MSRVDVTRPVGWPVYRMPNPGAIGSSPDRDRTWSDLDEGSHSIGSADVIDDDPLDFHRIDRAGLAAEDDLASRGDQQGVGDRAGPFLVKRFGEGVAILGIQEVVGRGDVV